MKRYLFLSLIIFLSIASCENHDKSPKADHEQIEKLRTLRSALPELYRSMPIGELAKLDTLLFESGDTLNAPALEDLKLLTNLEGLHFIDCLSKDSELSLIAGLENLRYIEIKSDKIDGRGLKYLSGLKRLTTLILQIPNLNPSSLEPLTELPSLKSVLIRETPLTPETLKRLASLNASEMDLSEGNFPRNAFKALSENRTITDLYFKHSNIQDEDLCSITSMKLVYLNLSQTQIGDAGADCILQMKNLRYLNIMGSRITPQKALQLGKESSIVIIEIDYTMRSAIRDKIKGTPLEEKFNKYLKR